MLLLKDGHNLVQVLEVTINVVKLVFSRLGLDIEGISKAHNLCGVALAPLLQVTELKLDGEDALSIVIVHLLDLAHVLLPLRPLAKVHNHADLLKHFLVDCNRFLELFILGASLGALQGFTKPVSLADSFTRFIGREDGGVEQILACLLIFKGFIHFEIRSTVAAKAMVVVNSILISD